MKKPLIGILSGSGPEAGLYVAKCLHRYVQEKYGAIQDQDYPDYVLYNKPLDGFDETGIADYEKVLISFQEALQNMFDMGVTIVGIACNTLHSLLNYIIFPEEIHFCHLIELCGDHFMDKEKPVLVLSSATTRKEKLYLNVLDNKSEFVIQVTDIEQKFVDNVIEKVMGNNYSNEDFELIQEIIKKYDKKNKLGDVILGCTELPLVFEGKESYVPAVSSSEILAECLVEKYIDCNKKNKVSGNSSCN